MQHNDYLTYRYSQNLRQAYEETAIRERLLKSSRSSLRLKIAKGFIAFGEWLEPCLREMQKEKGTRLQTS